MKTLITFIVLSLAGIAHAQKPEIFVHLGHTGGVESVALSPDGHLALSGSEDNTVKLWDVSAGRGIRTLVGHTGRVHGVAFSPDGKMALSGGEDKTLRLWDLSNGKEIRTFYGHTGSINGVAYSKDGKLAISGSSDKTVKLWDMVAGREIASFVGHSDRLESVAFSPDGRYVISGGVDATIRMWDVSTAREILSFRGHAGWINGVIFSPDGRSVLSCSHDSTIKLWSVSSGKLLRTMKGHSGLVWSIAFSPDGKRALSGGGLFEGNIIRVWELSTGKETRTLQGHTGDVKSIVFSPDGKSALSGSLDQTIRLWDLSTGTELRKFTGNSSYLTNVAFSPDQKLAITGSGNGMLNVWDVSKGKRIRCLYGHSGPIGDIVFSPDGKSVLTGGSAEWPHSDGTIRMWDVSSGRQMNKIEAHAVDVSCLAVSLDGKSLLSAGMEDGYLKLWDVATGKELRTFSGETFGIASIAFSPDGRTAVSGGGDNSVRCWDVSTGKQIRVLTGHAQPVSCVAFSPDGRLILSGSQDKTVRVWDASTGREIRRLDGNNSILSLSFSPDGKLVLCGGYRARVEMFEIASGKTIRSFNGHPAGVWGVDFSSDGKRAISCADDRTTRVWDAETGRELTRLVSFDDGEWVALTQEGYFNCSPNGGKNINVRMGTSVYSIDNFFESYFRPDIVKARLSGETEAVTTTDITKGIKTPPTVAMKALRTSGQFVALSLSNATDLAITGAAIKIKVSAVDAGGGIQGVRLFNNGKSVGENIRAFKAVQSDQTFEQEFTVTLTEGENKLSAVGFSEDLTESNPINCLVTYKATLTVKPDMHVLAIGINEYRNSKYNLNYCVDDVKGFVDVITPKARKLFANIHTATITDREATRSNVLKALADIQAKAKPEDVLIIFYAGHGIALDVDVGGTMKNDFFYVLSDVTQMTDPLRCSQDGISGTEMRKTLSEIKAAKQVMFVDACNSGAFAQQFAARGAAEENALAKLSRATGSVIYASTTKDQFATEFKDLHHGAFTYVLIDALNGQASLANGEITVSSIKAFVDDQIPMITKKYKGEEQFPTTFIWGQDFPIGVK